MTIRSAAYAGYVTHHRLKPRRYNLTHKVYWLLLDLDELEELDRRLRLFAYNGPGAFSLCDGDHGDGSGTPLRSQIIAQLDAAGLATDGIRVALLCMPRVLGYDFNPISVYYCSAPTGEAVAMVYEVNNTFHQRHSYIIPVDPDRKGPIVQSSRKNFYVSPFLDLDMSYVFRTDLPGQMVHLSVQGLDAEGPVINTALHGTRRPLNDWTLLKLLLAMPFLTIKIIVAIHWHALRMWLAGFKLTDQPPTPKRGTTIIRRHS